MHNQILVKPTLSLIFSEPGEEIYLPGKTIHAYNQQDWVTFPATAQPYLEKYGKSLSEQDQNAFQKAIDENR